MIKTLWYRLFPKDPINPTKLSEAQWQNLLRFSKKASKPIKEGYQIELLQAENLHSIIELNNVAQEIMPNGDFENHLLKLSLIDSKPREVLTVRFKYYGQKYLQETTLKVYGNHDSVNFSDIEYKLLGADLSRIEVIEFSHTHPSYALKVKTPTGTRLRFNELTPADIAVAKSFASRLPSNKKVIMRAIVPNGFSYNLELDT